MSEQYALDPAPRWTGTDADPHRQREREVAGGRAGRQANTVTAENQIVDMIQTDRVMSHPCREFLYVPDPERPPNAYLFMTHPSYSTATSNPF